MRPSVSEKTFFLTLEIVLRLLNCGAIYAILCPALREPGIAIDVPTQSCCGKALELYCMRNAFCSYC